MFYYKKSRMSHFSSNKIHFERFFFSLKSFLLLIVSIIKYDSPASFSVTEKPVPEWLFRVGVDFSLSTLRHFIQCCWIAYAIRWESYYCSWKNCHVGNLNLLCESETSENTTSVSKRLLMFISFLNILFCQFNIGNILFLPSFM